MELADVTSATPNNEELVYYYREGLKPQIRTFLAARGTITDLKQLQNVALQIDAAMFSRGSSKPINIQSSRPPQHRGRNDGNPFSNSRNSQSHNQPGKNNGRRDFSRYPPRYPTSFGS